MIDQKFNLFSSYFFSSHKTTIYVELLKLLIWKAELGGVVPQKFWINSKRRNWKNTSSHKQQQLHFDRWLEEEEEEKRWKQESKEETKKNGG